MGARCALSERRTRGFERYLIDAALVVVEGAIEAIELVGRERISGAARLDVGEAAVVLLFVGLEGAEQVVEREAKLGRALDLGSGSGGH
jgi:hypothetical protein